MPICNKPTPVEGNNKSASEIDDHASEAAKVKRTREQAYFNSYNFDAIEVLPYDDDADGDANTDIETDRNHRRKPPINTQHTASQGIAIAASQHRTQQYPPASQNGRQRAPAMALSSSHSVIARMPHSDSSRSSSNYSQENDVVKYTYMQRLSAFFVNSAQPQLTGATKAQAAKQSEHSVSSTVIVHDVAMPTHDGMPTLRSDEAATADNGNFLLPRAKVKYQSVASSNTISMPLAVSSAAQTATGKALHNADNGSCISRSSSGGGGVLNDDYNSNKNSNSKQLMMTSSSNALQSNSGQTRPNYANGNDANSGFLMEADKIVAATVMPLPKTTTTITTMARNKKTSTSSTTSTIAISVTSLDDQHSQKQSISSIDNSNSNSNRNINATSSNTTNKVAQQARPASSTTSKESAEKRGGRAGSHYSTDKSGSSGYYSSNVCSTYSVEDHIYCEPVIGVLDVNSASKSVTVAGRVGTLTTRQQQQQQQLLKSAATTTVNAVNVNAESTHSNSQSRDMKGVGQSNKFEGGCDDDDDDDEADDDADGSARKARKLCLKTTTMQRQINEPLSAMSAPHFNEHLRILETSIENLDRHLKNFPSLSSQEHITSFVHQHTMHADIGDKLRAYTHLPTIMEGYDPKSQPRPWQDDIADDSLLDIDLDSFLLANERNSSKRNKRVSKPTTTTATANASGIVNPSFLADEQEENNYKCAKYINSCPEDAYRVESDIVTGSGSVSDKSAASVEHFLKRYEDQLHFQSTRELLEDVRDKIRLLSRSRNEMRSRSENSMAEEEEETMPIELEHMIKTLKRELESYIERMNKHSEQEIRQLCSGIVKNQNIVKIQKAFERRRSITSLNAFEPEYDYSAYEAVRDGMLMPATNVPNSLHPQTTSLRCTSDPNFKMKRKSLTEVFPVSDCYIESVDENPRNASNDDALESAQGTLHTQRTQLQRNLSFHKPILNQLDTRVGPNGIGAGSGLGGGNNAPESGKAGSKDSILEWHRKKPSIWEMYYGTNRMHQSLLGKRNGMIVNSNHASMSYPSSRPESDFTLDLPRAEQLRIKMEKEKKFRQRCRYITTFLSLIFFLLTVMVVSLVLTRGKRMFGSMI